MVQLKHSVRASGDIEFMRIQEIAQMRPSKYTNEILTEFQIYVQEYLHSLKIGMMSLSCL